MEYITIQMVIDMKENGKIINVMVMEYYTIQTEINI